MENEPNQDQTERYGKPARCQVDGCDKPVHKGWWELCLWHTLEHFADEMVGVMKGIKRQDCDMCAHFTPGTAGGYWTPPDPAECEWEGFPEGDDEQNPAYRRFCMGDMEARCPGWKLTKNLARHVQYLAERLDRVAQEYHDATA